MSLTSFAQETYLQERREQEEARKDEIERLQEKREDIIDIARHAFKAWLRTGVPTNLELPDPELEVEAVPTYGGYSVRENLPAQVIFRADGMRFKVEGEYPVHQGSQPWAVSVEAIPLHDNHIQTHLKGWFKVRSVADLGNLIDKDRVKRYE